MFESLVVAPAEAEKRRYVLATAPKWGTTVAAADAEAVAARSAAAATTEKSQTHAVATGPPAHRPPQPKVANTLPSGLYRSAGSRAGVRR